MSLFLCSLNYPMSKIQTNVKFTFFHLYVHISLSGHQISYTIYWLHDRTSSSFYRCWMFTDRQCYHVQSHTPTPHHNNYQLAIRLTETMTLTHNVNVKLANHRFHILFHYKIRATSQGGSEGTLRQEAYHITTLQWPVRHQQ